MDQCSTVGWCRPPQPTGNSLAHESVNQSKFESLHSRLSTSYLSGFDLDETQNVDTKKTFIRIISRAKATWTRIISRAKAS